MKLRGLFACTTVLTTLLAAVPAMAEEVDPQDGRVEEIIVTARKTFENLQTTPVAVSAFNAAALANRQVTEINDLPRATPNFNVITGGSGGAAVAQFSIRGQAQPNITSSNDAPVGLYVDGVYYARAISNNGATLDLANVQVLRGPQGTLFGRNTTGGAVVMTSNEPVDQFAGSLTAGIGNLKDIKTEGVINIPLSDTVYTRVAALYESRNGYVFNANSGKREGDSANYFVRAAIKWAPDNLPITLKIVGDATDYKDNGSPASLYLVDQTQPLGGMGAFLKSLPGTDFYTSFSGVTSTGSLVNTNLGLPAGYGATGNSEIDTPRNRLTAMGTSATLDVDFGGTKLKSITAWRKSNYRDTWDLDGVPFNGLAFASQYTQHQFSQELQLSGEVSKFDWMAGAYFFREAGTERSDAWQFLDFSRDSTEWSSRSIGAFAQGTYHVNDDLRVTGGIRYTWDRRFADLHGVYGVTRPDYSDGFCAEGANISLPAASNPCSEKRNSSFKYPAWLVSIDGKLADTTFVYAKTSGASMAGGVNFRFAPASSRAFRPEDVRDVELGLKTDLFDRRLRFNAALFYIWRSDLQVNLNPYIPPRGSTQYQINAGKAHQYGAELETTIVPWEGMTLDGSFAYLHSSYVKGSYIAVDPVSGIPVDHSGDPVSQSPKYQWNIGATQKLPLKGIGTMSLHADYNFVSLYYQYPDSTNGPAVLAAGSVPGHGLLNAKATLALSERNVEVSVWGRNLANEEYITATFSGLYGYLGVSAGTVGAPRTYGVSVSVKW